MLLRGVGMGLAFRPAMTAAFAALERSELGDATPQRTCSSESAAQSASRCSRWCCPAR
jgi:hypothetical protein